ncbi:response regulator transcription factor [Paucibacter sp. XJ19-41]|uniref:response regulator transcription factor n=1 Tax=Paucibacter sp. XJ19-41 TaxID=2927824 RepID=UPI00234BC91B|nr:response regulator transcription factor [Paucibacter sp. XJ19-41]MDC6167453.1 response regulator transcription factor [Paucibacter sp. XJ19-41]
MHILLVEDDLQLGSALSSALAGAGFRPTWLRRLAEAHALLADGGVDGLLLDLGLPDGDGMSLLSALRDADKRLPVLLITARDQLDDRLLGLQCGADDYLVKPFAVPEMLARLHAVLRRASGQAAACWRVGALQIDVEQHRVETRGRVIGLTAREYQLLLELARQAGRVVPKRRLIERVWGGPGEVTDTTLEYFVHQLRRKLPPAAIHTVRGVGYFLAVQ